MTHSAQNDNSHVSAVMKLGTCRSSLDLSKKQVRQARDCEILAAVHAGSTAAFEELQRLYSGPLLKTILRITRNREDAEDALQDTLLRAFLGLPRFEARSSIYSWLTRIAINSIYMILRKRRARPDSFSGSLSEAGESYPALEIRDTAPNPEQLCDLRQRGNCVLRAIQTLEPKLRAPIEIRLANEFTMKEIASILNISVAAVKTRIYRARVHLSKRVSPYSGQKKRPSPALGSRHIPVCPQNREQLCRISD